MKNLIATIITIPLIRYHEKLYWGLFTEYKGKPRNHIMQKGNAGKQILFAFDKALYSDGDILIIIDDKFNSERAKDEDPTNDELEDFLSSNPLPLSWINEFNNHNLINRIIIPPNELSCGTYGFSEKKLYAKSRNFYGFPGECANEWTLLLQHLQNIGYEKIHAYIPNMCAKGICLASPYAKENGILTEPLVVDFTDNNGIVSEYSI